jgi:hypothetical protein
MAQHHGDPNTECPTCLAARDAHREAIERWFNVETTNASSTAAYHAARFVVQETEAEYRRSRCQHDQDGKPLKA